VKGFCPHCEKERDLTSIQSLREYTVKGEKIAVQRHVLKCQTCDKEFDPPDDSHDPLDEAYREYRARHGMIQPAEIRRFRSSLGLSQSDLAGLLGWGGATLSRYENGALQDDAHDRALLLAMDTANLLRLAEANPIALPSDKLGRLISTLRARLGEDEVTLKRLYEARFGQYEPDIYTGYRRFSLERVFNAILFFCTNLEVVKTKLNKLLFYSDFKHFKDYTVSITGARYAHLPYGPAPDGYSSFLAMLQEGEKSIVTEERMFNDHVGEVLIALRSPDIAAFSSSEIKVLALVKERFDSYSAKQLSDLSHKEKGYLETHDGELISYDHAESLAL